MFVYCDRCIWDRSQFLNGERHLGTLCRSCIAVKSDMGTTVMGRVSSQKASALRERARSCWAIAVAYCESLSTACGSSTEINCRALHAVPFSDVVLLMFLATQPGLRHLELLTLTADRRTHHHCTSCSLFFKAPGDSCPHRESLMFTMFCPVERLAWVSIFVPPAYPVLRCLDLDRL